MTDARRYNDDEIAAIFEVAASPRPAREQRPSSADGLTLAELQAIGREVGVAPERIAEAASALDRGAAAGPRRTYFGMPVSVGRVVDLSRAPTDREWELIVAELRETFGAHGHERSHGNLRAWTNGNLHALVEPTESGYRLRLGTLKGDAAPLMHVGLGGVLLGGVLSFIVGFDPPPDYWLPLFVGGVGVLTLAYNALRLPRWAARREAQMEYIAARARALLAPAQGVDDEHKD